ncbi:MAG: CHASE domain-containing protein [Candidatus Korobacteraceae bacterium]
MNSNRKFPRCGLPMLGILTLGSLLSLALLLVVRDLEERRAHADFENLAQMRFDGLDANIRLTLNNLAALGDLYSSSHSVERPEFADFASGLLQRDNAIQALEWAPWVKQDERASYELRTRREGLPSFEFTERVAQGTMRREPERAEYFPVFYVEPLRGNERAVGFDLASNAARRATLMRAALTGEMAATEPLILVQEKKNQYGFLVFRPALKKGAAPNNSRQRRQALLGLVLGVFRIEDIVNRSGSSQSSSGSVSLAIFDVTVDSKPVLMFPKDSHFKSAAELQHFLSIQAGVAAG